MNRRGFLGALLFVGVLTTKADAQLSQRARQIRERRACEQDLPTCKPAIRVQLEAERRRMRFGFATLAVGVLIGGGLLAKRHVRMRREAQEAVQRLDDRLDSHARDSSKNRS